MNSTTSPSGPHANAVSVISAEADTDDGTERISHTSRRAPILVAVIQYRGSNESHEESRELLIQAIQEAGESGVRVVVAPECASSDYLFEDAAAARHYSETFGGPLTSRLEEVARAYNMWCVIGVIERDPSGALYNSAFITQPSGESLCYRKRFLFETDELWAESGDEHPSPHRRGELTRSELELGDDPTAPYPLIDVLGWRMTVGICMDLNDPRFIHFCERAHVNLIAFPTNWLDEGYDVLPYWAYMLRDLPDAYLLAANSHGVEDEITFCGTSAVLRSNPPTLYGSAPHVGDYIISVTIE